MGFFGELLQDVTGKSKRPEIKGGRFENFVSDEIFTDKLFDLVEMTRDFNSNSERCQLPLPATLQRAEEGACMSLINISDHLMRMGD